jgi:hypothetical protein
MKRLMFSLLFLLALMACATTQIKEGRPDGEDLRDALTRYWTYRIQTNAAQSYYYEHVSYTKLATKEFYMGGFGGQPIVIRSFEILEIGEEGSGPMGYTPVQLKIKMSWPGAPFPVPDIMENKMKDYWVKKDGRWYHLLARTTGFY